MDYEQHGDSVQYVYMCVKYIGYWTVTVLWRYKVYFIDYFSEWQNHFGSISNEVLRINKVFKKKTYMNVGMQSIRAANEPAPV